MCLHFIVDVLEKGLAPLDRILVECGRRHQLALLQGVLVVLLGELLGQTSFLSDRKLSLVQLHLIRLDKVVQVFISMLHRLDLVLILLEHDKLAVTDLADLTE